MRMVQRLLLIAAVAFSFSFAHAAEIPMEVDILPDFGFVISTDLVTSMDIEHQGGNTKYTTTFKVYSNLEAPWGIAISAPPMLSTDGKDRIQNVLVNYKIYGGTGTTIPSQTSNVWNPLPVVDTVMYRCAVSELVVTEIPLRLSVFVTPRTTQTQKVYKTRVKVSLVRL